MKISAETDEIQSNNIIGKMNKTKMFLKKINKTDNDYLD